jgi:hypothetical protein
MNYVPIHRAIKQFGLIGSLFGFLQGRATAFAICFTVCGIVLAFHGKLTSDYVALVGAIQTLVIGHSIKEDYFSSVNRQAQQQQVVNNITIDSNAPNATKS